MLNRGVKTMRLSKISALCFAATTAFAASSAMAWESEDGAWSTSANVALASEYMWRGQDLSGSDPAISGGFDVGHSSGFYIGTWASNIEADDGSIEIDYYAGYANEFGDSGVGYDVGFLYYDFPGIDDFDYAEVYGFLSYSFLSAGVSYSVDAFDADWEGADDNLYYQIDASYDVGMFTLAAGYGYNDYDDEDVIGLEDYANYYIGASTELAGFGFDLTFHDVDSDGEDNGFDDTVVFTISKSL
jgi:uncharacterized protein (TIGR02001 family)